MPVVGPGLSKDDFLLRFGAADGQALGLRLLRDAVQRQDGEDVALALIVCSAFGFTADHVDPLVGLVGADWHVSHENVVAALGRLKSPSSVDALYHATQWVPGYLLFDEDRALAMKAVRALAAMPGERAEQTLLRVIDSSEDLVRQKARQQLDKRKTA